MPHLVLEYSDNVAEPDFIELLQRCHSVLTKLLPTQLESCKSRVIKQSVYYLGDGKPENAFVSVTLKIMPGRNAETLQLVSQGLMDILKNYFSASLKKLNLQISIEIAEIAPSYNKFTL